MFLFIYDSFGLLEEWAFYFLHVPYFIPDLSVASVGPVQWKGC